VYKGKGSSSGTLDSTNRQGYFPRMLPQWVIERKRDGNALSDAEIREFVTAYTRGDIPDYQAAALAMAIYFQGMSDAEVSSLTDAMMHSGELIDTAALPGIKADKHSTGGIGDKVSLILAPLAACCGLVVPMISGRGLGLTGGTLDKLESIEGYRTALDKGQFLTILRDCGCSIIGQTKNLVPADRKLYALRDVTGTVPSIPLIASSIMSKKLAEGIDVLVLDVKCGSGAFMKDLASARRLAGALLRIGQGMNKRVRALVTDMNQPLGRSAGNAVEVAEAIAALKGSGPADLEEVTVSLTGSMLAAAGMVDDEGKGKEMARTTLHSGRALETFGRMVAAHGGKTDIIDFPDRLPQARWRRDFVADRGGYVARADAEAVGRACLILGAGRRQTADPVDPAVGISNIASVGTRVEPNQPLAVIHANDEGALAEADSWLRSAFTIQDEPQPSRPVIIDTLT
jgi:pyrimidine-nucleoside phosphorylase